MRWGSSSGASARSASIGRRSLVVGIAVAEPGFGGVRVAAYLPEAFVIVGQKLDLPNPLRALPRVELRRDHAARAAMLAWERTALPRMHQQHIVFNRAL